MAWSNSNRAVHPAAEPHSYMRAADAAAGRDLAALSRGHPRAHVRVRRSQPLLLHHRVDTHVSARPHPPRALPGGVEQPVAGALLHVQAAAVAKGVAAHERVLLDHVRAGDRVRDSGVGEGVLHQAAGRVRACSSSG